MTNYPDRLDQVQLPPMNQVYVWFYAVPGGPEVPRTVVCHYRELERIMVLCSIYGLAVGVEGYDDGGTLITLKLMTDRKALRPTYATFGSDLEESGYTVVLDSEQ